MLRRLAIAWISVSALLSLCNAAMAGPPAVQVQTQANGTTDDYAATTAFVQNALSYATAVAASGSSASTATQLTTRNSVVTTATSGEGVALPTSIPMAEVVNGTNVMIYVYPATGSTLNGSSTEGVALAAGDQLVAIESGTNWSSGTSPVRSVAGRTGDITLSATDISGLAASATTDTTNAGNITSGTLPPSQLPVATSSTSGAVKPDGTTLTNTAGALSVTYGTTANTAAQGNDSRITGAVQSAGGTLANGTLTDATISDGTISGADLSGSTTLPAGSSGAGSTTLASLSQTFTPASSFGAKCDGVTDDTNALGYIFAAVAAGWRVALPAGTCKFSTLSIQEGTNTGGILEGQGEGATSLSAISGQTMNLITITGASGYGEKPKIWFKDLTIDCNNSGLICIHMVGSTATYTQMPGFEHINIQFSATGYDEVSADTEANWAQWEDVTLTHPGRNGLTLAGAADWRIHHLEEYGADHAGFAISSVSNNGSGLFRLTTKNSTGLTAGQSVSVAAWGFNGTTGPQGVWTATVVDANDLDLTGSTFAEGWTSQGWVAPIWTITGAAEDGTTGLWQVTTSAPHGYSSGQQIYIWGVQGASRVNGVWTITVIDGTHFDLQNSLYSSAQTYTSGGTAMAVAVGVLNLSPGSNYISDSTFYTNLLAMAVVSSSSNTFHVTNGEINGNYMGGILLQREDIAAPDLISNVSFEQNSVLGNGLYSDLQIADAGTTGLLGDQFTYSIVASKYNVEVNNLVQQLNYGSIFRWDGGLQPWSVAFTNDGWAANNRWAVASGYRTNSGGLASTATGYRSISSGTGSLVGGYYGRDATRPMLAFGNGLFHVAGDNQAEIQQLSGTTTGAVTTRLVALSTTSTTPGTNNVLNLPNNYTVQIDHCTVTAKAYNGTDVAVWSLNPIAFARGASASATSILSGTNLLTSGPQTASYATSNFGGLSLSVTADTTNGGIDFSGTGTSLISNEVDWYVVCFGGEN